MLEPREASSLTRWTGTISEQSLLHSPPPHIRPPHPNRKHTYPWQGHLPARACPLCGRLYKPGIVLPRSPGRTDTQPSYRETPRFSRMTNSLVSGCRKFITYYPGRYTAVTQSPRYDVYVQLICSHHETELINSIWIMLRGSVTGCIWRMCSVWTTTAAQLRIAEGTDRWWQGPSSVRAKTWP